MKYFEIVHIFLNKRTDLSGNMIKQNIKHKQNQVPVCSVLVAPSKSSICMFARVICAVLINLSSFSCVFGHKAFL